MNFTVITLNKHIHIYRQTTSLLVYYSKHILPYITTSTLLLSFEVIYHPSFHCPVSLHWPRHIGNACIYFGMVKFIIILSVQ